MSHMTDFFELMKNEITRSKCLFLLIYFEREITFPLLNGRYTRKSTARALKP